MPPKKSVPAPVVKPVEVKKEPPKVEDLLKQMSDTVKDSEFNRVGLSNLNHQIKLKEGEVKRLDLVLSGLRKELDQVRANILVERKNQLDDIDAKHKAAKAKDAEAQVNVEKSRKLVNEAAVERHKVFEMKESLERAQIELTYKLNQLKELASKL